MMNRLLLYIRYIVMKSLENYKTMHALAESSLAYLKEKDVPVKRYILDDYLSEVIIGMIGKDEYDKQELKCIGVAHESVKSLKRDGLVEETGSVVSITRKGKLVLGLTYPVYATIRNWTAVDYVLTKSSRYTTSAVLVLLIPALFFAVVILEATGLLQQLKEFLCKLLQGLLK